MDYTPLIEKRRQRLEELETVIAEPDFFNDQKRDSETMREHRRLKELMETWDSLNATEQQLSLIHIYTWRRSPALSLLTRR